VLGTWKMQTDQTGGSRVSFSYNFDQKRRERERPSCFSRISLSLYDGRGRSGNAEERRGEERATEKALLACLSVLLTCLCVFEFP
jgi:hypothetical protein